MKILSKMKGFTLAEVLITLTIIGVVAALTIPSLLANVNDKTYSAKRRGFETRLAQALSQMDNLNSYGNDEHTSSMEFVINGLSKVYKITNVCEFENFAACDFPTSLGVWHNASRLAVNAMKKPNNRTFTAKNGALMSDGVTFKTKNGESVLLWHNPNCVAEQNFNKDNYKNIAKEICIVMIIDLDGAKKGTNALGKDISLATVMHPDNPNLMLMNGMAMGIGGPKPSYSSPSSTSDDDNAEKYCEISSGFGFPKGAWTLASLNMSIPYAAGYTSGNNQYYVLSDIDGSNDTDYAYHINWDLDVKKELRTVPAQVHCMLKKVKW